MKATWRNRSLLLVLTLLGAGAPLAQAVRLVEVHHGGADSRSSYTLQATPASAALPDLDVARNESSTAADAKASDKTAEGQKRPQPPRLIRLVPDHWDVAGPLEFALAEVPVPLAAFSAEASISRPCGHACPLPFSSGPPGIVSTRGPPAA